jgi:hypothetical protein
MTMRTVLVFLDQPGIHVRRRLLHEIKQDATKVLATYPHAVLAEVTDDQIAALKAKGYSIDLQEASQAIHLRTVEIDTGAPVPEAPAAFRQMPGEHEQQKSNYWIVQFIGPAMAEWSAQLQELGAEIDEYVPVNAFLVKMPAGVVERIKAMPFVKWTGAYEPIYKVSPQLAGRKRAASQKEIGSLSIQADAFQSVPEGNLTVLLHRASDLNEVSKFITDQNGTIINAEGNTLIVSLAPTAIGNLAKNTAVKWIEPFMPSVLHNDVSAPIIGVQPVWNEHALDGEEQIVSVADTGLDTGVNDATMNADFRGRIVNIYDRAGDGANDVRIGHGTHVAGSVLGNGTNSGGTIRGMSPAARLVFQSLSRNTDGNLTGIPADYNTLFQQAYNDGARIHTNSWGNHQHGQYTAASQDIDEFMWNHKDSIILFSASNDGVDANSNGVIDDDSLSSQASSKNCITVGATEGNRPHGSTPAPGYDIDWATGSWAAYFPVPPISTDHVSNNPQGMAAFSGRGPTDDGRPKPDVVAPGTNILSVRSSAWVAIPSEPTILWGDLPAANPLHDLYCWSGGTSMSTPLTAGTVALIRQYLQKVCGYASPSGALMKAILIHGASAITGQYVPSEVGPVPDNSQGWGLVNLNNALFPAFPAYWQYQDKIADALATGEHRDYTYQVTDGSVPFRATLVWTDYPSNPSGAIGLVNQLRLSIIAPGGATTQGAPANNNVQQVVINSPAIGTYTVRVSGINVSTVATLGQRQDFSVVVSAGLEFVELYIKDNASDNGIAPSIGVECYSPDIWVSDVNDPSAPPVANPEHGQPNYVFVRVHNRGSKAANGASVNLYWANPGTNLSRPFWSTDGISIDGVPGNIRHVDVPAHSGAGDGETVTLAFEWDPPDPSLNVYDEGHFCLFASVDHPDDPLVSEDVGSVRWEDNLAWKNIVDVDVLPNSIKALDFYIAGKQGESAFADLHIDRSGLPAAGKVRLKIPSRYLKDSHAVNLAKSWESEGGKLCIVEVTSAGTASLSHVHLESRENTLVHLEVTMPPTFKPGDVYPVSVEQYTNGQPTGRVTLVARMVGTPAYLANRNSGEIHYPNCEWSKKISHRNVVPFQDLDLALKRGYNGCRFCLPKFSTD